MTWTPHRSRRRSRVPKRSSSAAAVIVLLMAAASCAPKRFAPPADAGTPAGDPAALWSRVAESCAGTRSLTAELALSGRAGGTRLRGRVQAGFAAGSMRLEGVAPFGQPIFILAATSEAATLLLPRDERVVRTADAAEILDALVGVRLDPDALMTVLAGCGLRSTPTGATQHGDVTRFTFPEGEVYLRAFGIAPRVVAARVGPFLVEYLEMSDIATRPRRVRLSRDPGQAHRVDLTIGVSQIQRNVALPAAAFTIDVPPGTAPMTLAELRAAGPLGARD